jgi:hypothetical protein
MSHRPPRRPQEVRAVTLEEIAVREVQECSCICYYPAR